MFRWLGKLTAVEYLFVCIIVAVLTILTYMLLEACGTLYVPGGAGP